jgi:hypothetical protein
MTRTTTLSITLALAACGDPAPTDHDAPATGDGATTDGVTALDAAPPDAAVPCTETLAPGDDVPTAAAVAPDGSVICLETGTYGVVELVDLDRTGYVTLRSATGHGAVIAPRIGNSHYLRLESLTISPYPLQNACSSHVQWVNNEFAAEGLTLTNDGCGDLATLIDHNRFTGFDVGGGFEGRLSLAYGSGITITNNYFGDGGASDGIQLVGGVRNVEIGPGNTFDGILQSLCGDVHCDAIQLYGAGSGIAIRRNLFRNGDTYIMAPDGSNGVTVVDNVFDGTASEYEYKIQFGSAANPVFRHNTLLDTSAAFDSKDGEPASSNAVGRDNLFDGFSHIKTAGGSGCTGCTFSSNLFADAGNASGSDNVIGTPAYTGGANPPTWAGWQLAAGSPGVGAATDGADLGTTYYGP